MQYFSDPWPITDRGKEKQREEKRDREKIIGEERESKRERERAVNIVFSSHGQRGT